MKIIILIQQIYWKIIIFQQIYWKINSPFDASMHYNYDAKWKQGHDSIDRSSQL